MHKQIDLKVKKMLGRRSKLLLENKLPIYKTIWVHGIELWRCTRMSNTDKPI